jgi:hypothetical protein
MGVLVNPDVRNDVIRGIEQALGNPDRHVSPALEYYAFSSFEARCHEMLAKVLEPSIKPAV